MPNHPARSTSADDRPPVGARVRYPAYGVTVHGRVVARPAGSSSVWAEDDRGRGRLLYVGYPGITCWADALDRIDRGQ